MAAAVLNSEENIYFSSPLHRSHSQPRLITQSYSKSSLRSSRSHNNFVAKPASSDSTLSSADSSPRTLHADSIAPSFNSTPASSLSLDNREDEDQIIFPSYGDEELGGYYNQIEDLEPPASPRTGESYTVSPTFNTNSTNVSVPGTPNPVEHAEDDTAVRTQPSRHVDYLSHNWKEEDIWSSWKLIVSKRKAYNNSARLENASWRTWMKSKYKLKTVSPETLNWLKDCDVTWLYGPLQTGNHKAYHIESPANSPINMSRISKSNSFLQKKPILKKRSMSELMLQRSISSSSLLKQAAAAVQAQQSLGVCPGLGRANSDFSPKSFSSRRLSNENHPSVLTSISSSGISSPSTGSAKHIHFNESVEQCIAIEIKGDDEMDIQAIYDDDDSDSDDGAIMMKGSNSRRKLPPLKRPSTLRSSFSADSRTIAMLPSTTLKYRGDTPEPPESAMKHSTGFWAGSKLSPSASQETLRPSKPSTRIFMEGDDEDDVDMDWQPQSSRNDRMVASQERFRGGLRPSSATAELIGEPSGMRRTPSGMFMPYEEDEDDIVSEGLFGKVVDTVNTAKDIAHVIWNVGWRR
ncbi:hypothetical protein BJ878DRAFT_10690 [Calycina marina]|uniref:Nitrogen regulatory protein areA GATA-like domain-containing protein n=1 Tax=Calycina marina TaxID=1763456 RepID=A0A9P7Z534_9HELO|nr:hypothetical protein BJ878DRAFT_10690 [Calycina marina]